MCERARAGARGRERQRDRATRTETATRRRETETEKQRDRDRQRQTEKETKRRERDTERPRTRDRQRDGQRDGQKKKRVGGGGERVRERARVSQVVRSTSADSTALPCRLNMAACTHRVKHPKVPMPSPCQAHAKHRAPKHQALRIRPESCESRPEPCAKGGANPVAGY